MALRPGDDKTTVSTENNTPTGRATLAPPESVVFGRSSAMQAIRQKVDKAAATNVHLLIQGDNGTGKEVLARHIHARSPWSSGPFVKVNCAAIPGSLLESELFGYQKGAFTGAYASKPGRVEMARCGTLFLDGIGELDMSLQAKLLQMLQDGQFCRIGDQEERRIEARVICAAGRQLDQAIASGNFRSDLYYRINVISLGLPPLSQRCEDIPVLAEYFLELFNQRFARSAPSFSPKTLQRLASYAWPGNIRELENWVARYVILGVEAEPIHVVPERRPINFSVQVREDGTIPLKRIAKDAALEMERHLILEVLNANHWNRRRTAQILDISYRALIYKIREAGLSIRPGRRNATSPGDTTSNSPE